MFDLFWGLDAIGKIGSLVLCRWHVAFDGSGELGALGFGSRSYELEDQCSPEKWGKYLIFLSFL